MAKPKVSKQAVTTSHLFEPSGPPPDFESLLKAPLEKSPLPSDFLPSVESPHLLARWQANPSLQNYNYASFVHAGGSGMVFKAISRSSAQTVALKIARHKLMSAPAEGNIARTLSPVSPAELRALESLGHPSLVRLYEAINEPAYGVIAVATTYIENPKNLDAYLRDTLMSVPRGRKKNEALSPRRLDNACEFLFARFKEVASALAHMHDQGIFHFDVKPANILIAGAGPRRYSATLTDMGASVHTKDMAANAKPRVHFTWTYAHEDLTSLIRNQRSITGGGLKASAELPDTKNVAKYDLFALGKTMQECLALLEAEFGERCHSTYAFRFLHLAACLLLDGKNVPAPSEQRGRRTSAKDGRDFVYDTTLGYPDSFFDRNKIRSAAELLTRLERFGVAFSLRSFAAELGSMQYDVVNSVAHSPAPFEKRVSALFNHPTMLRLTTEPQLGWMRAIYPGATHDRWSHSLGVFSAMVSYYSALLSDPEVPTMRLLADNVDIEHAFVAGIVHDLGQTAFGHDFEEAAGSLFKHEDIVRRLLFEPSLHSKSLAETIREYWPRIDIDRVLRILQRREAGTSDGSATPSEYFTDDIARDVISGPIDADKLDYLVRDSIFCGVPYGIAIDVSRFLHSLTITSDSTRGSPTRLAIAYRAKGRPAVASILLARYQMFGAVYWHHTYRCIQAMFVDAAATTFGGIENHQLRCEGRDFSAQEIRDVYYQRVLLGVPWATVTAGGRLLPRGFQKDVPRAIAQERGIDFVWRFADEAARALLERLVERPFYKRVFELRIGELQDRAAEYENVKSLVAPHKRRDLCAALQTKFIAALTNALRQRVVETTTSTSGIVENRIAQLKNAVAPLIVVDFPSRGIAQESNVPREIGDAMRKYFTRAKKEEVPPDNVFLTVRQLHQQLATLRIFAAPELHDLMLRYLTQDQVDKIVVSVIPLPP